jgi:hypothetical protein
MHALLLLHLLLLQPKLALQLRNCLFYRTATRRAGHFGAGCAGALVIVALVHLHVVLTAGAELKPKPEPHAATQHPWPATSTARYSGSRRDGVKEVAGSGACAARRG